VETLVSKERGSRKAATERLRGAKPISLASIPSKKTSRISTKLIELDRVLGGGLVSGQMVLIAGEPGIGKSTILLQLAEKLAGAGKVGDVLYVSGEESTHQIAIRGQRLGIRKKTIQLLEETDVDVIVSAVNDLVSNNQTPKAVIIDSIQTMSTSDLSGMAGSVGQVRECTYRLVRLAKRNNIPVFIVGHVTKQGSVAGPAVLMHIVDTVLWFEGDKSSTLRLLRTVKNRFGATDEVGVFSMEDRGLISMSSPEKIFLTFSKKNVSGSAIASVLQGTRPILVEIQSLVVPTKLAYPRRIAQGIDSKRFELLLAVLTRRCGLPFYEFDSFVNIAGGISVRNDPSVDLAICLSQASAYFDKPLSKSTIAIGEVGLLGEIREVIAQEKRVKEAKRLGFKNAITNRQVKYLQQAIKSYLK
jgi:DNA repair protein RadA/Sms